jgi:hypothetical protein
LLEERVGDVVGPAGDHRLSGFRHEVTQMEVTTGIGDFERQERQPPGPALGGSS